MRSSRLPFWLPIAGLMLPIALSLGWVLLRLAPSGQGSVPVTQTYLAENRHSYGIDEIAQLPREAWLKPLPQKSLSSRTNQAVWLRLELKNTTDQVQEGVLADNYRFTDRLDLWIPRKDGWEHLVSGQLTQPEDKAIPGRDSAFTVTLPARSARVAYLRLQDPCAIFTRPEWYGSATRFLIARSHGMLAEGIYFGVMLALLGYNLLLWIRLRILGLGWYALYLGATAVFLLFARLIPQELGLVLGSLNLVIILSASAAVSTMALVQFARRFLELSVAARLADKIAIGLIVAQGCIVAFSFLTPYFRDAYAMMVATSATAATHVTLLVIALVAWRSGVWQARFFVLSFSCLFIASLINITTWWEHSVSSDSLLSLMLGSALEMLLLALAVAERFALTQHQAVATQEKLAIEAGQRQLIEETYAEELEIEVRERTKDLETANAEKDRMLSVIGHDLRGPLAGLMREADDEPGDFARTTARIGRELLLLIEDLVLWARLGAGSRVAAVHPARNVLAPAVALHNALAEQGGTALIVEAGEALYVETDLVLTQTLMRNLLANALKFARTRVVLRAEGRPGSVRFSVTNDGPALSPEVAARIAADESGPLTASSGLGLRLCREICRAQGLKLEARSSPHFGTEFSFSVKAPSAIPTFVT